LLGGLTLVLIGVMGLIIYFPNYQQVTFTIGQLGGAINPLLQQYYNQALEYLIGMALSILAGLSLILYGAVSTSSISPLNEEPAMQTSFTNLLLRQKQLGWKFILKSENSEIIYRSMLSSSVGLILILIGFMGGVDQLLEVTINQAMLIIFLIGLALSVYGIFNLYKI